MDELLFELVVGGGGLLVSQGLVSRPELAMALLVSLVIATVALPDHNTLQKLDHIWL